MIQTDNQLRSVPVNYKGKKPGCGLSGLSTRLFSSFLSSFETIPAFSVFISTSIKIIHAYEQLAKHLLFYNQDNQYNPGFSTITISSYTKNCYEISPVNSLASMNVFNVFFKNALKNQDKL